MSTKKKTVSASIKPSEKKSLNQIAKKVAADHKNCPKPTLLAKKSDLKKIEPQIVKNDKFHIWDVYGVKYFIDDQGTPTRRTSMIEVTSDHDTANEPELRNRLIAQAEEELSNKGFFMTDVEAMEVALKQTEPVLDNLRHDVKYGEACQKCVAGRINEILDWMEYLRGWRDRRFALADELGGTCNLPPVIPNDYQENWHVDYEKHHLVPNTPKPAAVHSFEISNLKSINELPKVLEKLDLPKEALDNLKNEINKLPALKAPEKKAIEAKKPTPKKK